MIVNDDCVTAMNQMDENFVTAIVTDPPYDLTTASRNGSARTSNPDSSIGRRRQQSKGFMDQQWDGTGVAFDPGTWRAALRVLRPGGILLAFGGTRTYHRMACAVEDAGFEIRDSLMWLYGSGFPKNHDIAKALVRKGEERNDWGGWGTALKPAYEPIVVARKPLDGTYAANALAHGVAGLNIDGCRVQSGPSPSVDRRKHAAPGESVGVTGWSTPARPDSYNDQRPGELFGRWPANVLLDEEAGALLDAQSGVLTSGSNCVRRREGYFGAGGSKHGGLGKAGDVQTTYGDSGGASRFFYCAKSSRKERGEGNIHPTVKPLALMQYLVKLVTYPEHNLILDPFAGSGTTLLACQTLGIPFIGVEQNPDYCGIIKARLN